MKILEPGIIQLYAEVSDAVFAAACKDLSSLSAKSVDTKYPQTEYDIDPEPATGPESTAEPPTPEDPEENPVDGAKTMLSLDSSSSVLLTLRETPSRLGKQLVACVLATAKSLLSLGHHNQSVENQSEDVREEIGAVDNDSPDFQDKGSAQSENVQRTDNLSDMVVGGTLELQDQPDLSIELIIKQRALRLALRDDTRSQDQHNEVHVDVDDVQIENTSSVKISDKGGESMDITEPPSSDSADDDFYRSIYCTPCASSYTLTPVSTEFPPTLSTEGLLLMASNVLIDAPC